MHVALSHAAPRIWFGNARSSHVDLRDGRHRSVWDVFINCCVCLRQTGGSMFPRIKRLLGWIFGPLFALAIVLTVRFFERGLRLDIRRDPAWRSH
jgi:hypothetical protein